MVLEICLAATSKRHAEAQYLQRVVLIFFVVHSTTVVPAHYLAIGNKCFGNIFVYCLVVSQQFVVIMFIFLRGEVNFVVIEADKTVRSTSVDW